MIGPEFYDYGMERWTCPNCQRVFGRQNQSHLTCEPALSIDQYFATAKPFERVIFDKVDAHLAKLDGVIVDPLGIGILFKNGPMFAELRPKTRWTVLGFWLPRTIRSDRFSRKVIEAKNKSFHVMNIEDADRIDVDVLAWLPEAYHLAGGTLAAHRRSEPAEEPGGDGMVPDDIDEPWT
jgi:hypothetical protein